MSAPHSRRTVQVGFTLLEAIVALTIMATSLLALYAWLSTSTLALNRTQLSARALQDARTAMAVIETINPTEQPSGQRDLPPLQIRWQSRPLTQRRIGMSRSGTPTQFDFRLYEVDVEVRRDDTTVREFTVRRTGWDIARPILPDEP